MGFSARRQQDGEKGKSGTEEKERAAKKSAAKERRENHQKRERRTVARAQAKDEVGGKGGALGASLCTSVRA